MASQKKSNLYIVYGVLFAILMVLVIFVALGGGRKNDTSSKKAPAATEADKRNLLLNESERERLVKDFNLRVGKTSNRRMIDSSKIKFQLAPQFLERIKPRPTPQNVKAVSNICNLSEIPATVYVFSLDGHLLVEDAREVAQQYDVESIAYSLPTETTTYRYLFIRQDNTAAFSMYEASGIYTYTKVSTVTSSNLQPDNLRRYANQMLQTHRLDTNLSPPTYRTLGEITDFSYRKNLPDFMLVDEASIQSFFDQENCSVSDSDIMGLITVGVKNNGEVLKLINNTRIVTGTYKMSTIPITEAMVQYKDSQPLDPVLFPADAQVDFSQAFTIDSAVMAYYDVGPNFAQNLYIPIYVAHGFTKSTTGQDVQFLTFFPAVSADALVAMGLVRIVPEPGDRATQQQGTFGFATPTPHSPPPFQAKTPEFGSSGPGCPGNLIDFMVSCSVEGNVICRGQFTGTAASDTMNACTKGCSGKVSIVDVTGGTNPCDAIMQENGVTPDKINGEVPRQRIAPGGAVEVSCFISACPS